MWNGKNKAVTFSFDDGVTQDVRCVELLNKYGLKGTFNLNSGFFGLPGKLERSWGTVNHTKILASEVKRIYNGHEIAVHTLTHPTLVGLDEETIIRQVEEDRKALESLCGYPVVGMAYPNGPNDDRVAGIIKDNTPIRYSRTVASTYSYGLQKENLLRFNPTLHFLDDRAEEIAEEFLGLQTEEPQLLYIWGHSYEMDVEESRWARFEKLCQMLSGESDIFYGTNKEVLL